MPEHRGITVSLDVASILQTGLQYERSGFVREAEACYRQVLDHVPGHAAASYLLGALAERSGRSDMAVKFMRAAVAGAPAELKYLIHLGGLLLKQGGLLEALALFQAATKRFPDRPELLEKLGQLYLRNSQVEEAVTCCRQALAQNPNLVQAHANLGGLLIHLGQTEEGIASLTRATELAPRVAGLHAMLASNLIEVGNLPQGIAAFQRAVELQPDLMHAHAGLAAAYLQSGDPVSALRAAREGRARVGFATPLLASEYHALYELGDDDATRHLVDFERHIYREPLHVPAEFSTLADFNAALAAELLAHPSLRWEPIGRLTRAGWHSGLLHEQPTPVYQIFERELRKKLDQVIDALPADPQHPFFSRKPRTYGLQCWTCILETGGFQDSHIHAPGWLSGNYYVEVPKGIGAREQDNAGWIEFGRPPAKYPLRREPRLKAMQPRGDDGPLPVSLLPPHDPFFRPRQTHQHRL